ncbi:Rne/Rng family ribonuclease [Sphingomonas sp. LaA6.9]|uniref:Rne/Rng family ribonuclease n=1 Tax=Sphingomonas sp. LaA6.9 TaxID=2919914 RepID=UPI001F4F2580|nr:Rne/Rng family ribonuclease [Sphingomonas sp. LaA6.9]MCJ8158810.1 Rne/Rng family ribonuclease [Sphingomonas sp. LaA6.9]
MTMRMLIDARHREETRVAVVKGNRIEEFDFESAEHKQLKGNIYLAKVTRVEPSLQAAFVDYGGNRHGFLAFSEIHPDYYQIPKEDREALLREEAEHAAEEEALRAKHEDEDDEAHEGEDGDDHGFDEVDNGDPVDEDGEGDGNGESGNNGDRRRKRGRAQADDGAVEALRQKRMALRRRYKIQDVIRRRQVLLVQVVKEERGNKGAALTTYLSLAGRYCVLMPNTSNGGGISRKISNAGDRKRLKSIMADLKLPSSMGCIVRTAGLQRTKTEIKRDFDYLARLWDEIREKTLSSSAPALVYGDSDLIKRAIRDIYNRDIEEVIVEGEEGYRQAKDFMKLLMPSHARRVQPYSDAVPLFQRSNVEDQLAAMYNPTVQLKSGGYLVINPTEALVSIDINSGRSTREHGIEQTAVATNLEAAHEIARQLRLRDMAGLVVIDFIDMESNSNIRKVEKAMKAALANDRARIQVGRISSFGLMEMSRQRLRTGVLEASTRQCPHCEGTGLVRTASSAGLSALRMLEDEAARGRGSRLTLRASQEATIYVLNRKRAELAEIEERYGVTIDILPDGETEGARMSVESSGPPPEHAPRFEPVLIEEEDDLPIEEEEDEEEESEETESRREERGERDREGGRRRRRRGRGRRGRREEGEGRPEGETEQEAAADDVEEAEGEAVESEAEGQAERGAEDEESREAKRRRNRRGRRGGRRRREGGEAQDESTGVGEMAASGEAEAPSEPEVAEAAAEPEPVAEEKPKRTRRRPKAEAKVEAAVEAAPVIEAEPAAPAAEPEAEAAPAKPKRTRKKAAPKVEAEVEQATAEPAPVVEPEAEAEAASAKPKRSRKKAAPKVEAEIAAAAPVIEPAEASVAPAANDADADENDDSPRRGWWQRTFGGQE